MTATASQTRDPSLPFTVDTDGYFRLEGWGNTRFDAPERVCFKPVSEVPRHDSVMEGATHFARFAVKRGSMHIIWATAAGFEYRYQGRVTFPRDKRRTA